MFGGTAMTEETMESIITELVVMGGNGRGKALEAIRAAKAGEFEKAGKLLSESDAFIAKAHNYQTSFIQEALNEEENTAGVSLLMVHGQDHLMDAMVVNDLAKEMIEMYRMIYELKENR